MRSTHPQHRVFSTRYEAVQAAEERGWSTPDDDLTHWFDKAGHEFKIVETFPYSDWTFMYQPARYEHEPSDDEIFGGPL